MKIVKVKATTLAAPFSSSDTSLTLTDLVDSQGNVVALSQFGTEAFVVIVLKQGDVTEMVKCSAIVQNADGSATLTVASSGRDILPTTPWTGGGTGQDFAAGADAIVTNDPLTMSKFATLAEANAFTGANSFAVVPTAAADPVGNDDLTRKSYVLALVLGTLTTIDVIVPGTAGATIATGNLVYFDTATGKWKLARADTAATVDNVLLGIAQGAGTDTNPISNGVLLQGIDVNQSGMSTGAVQYSSNTPGAIAASPGTTNVVVGIAKSATSLYFAPRFNQEITQNQKDALAGNSGTPSSSNRYVTEAYVTTISPPGVITPYGGISAPTGWLMADGTAVSRTTYAALFAILNPSIGAFTVTIASPGVFSLTAHGLKEGDTVYLTTTGALPTGLTANTLYYVISAGLTANAFELSATRGGSVINTSGSQSGVHTLWRSPYGLGDGSTTFTLPNPAGKVLVGRDATDTVFALGETGGEKTHTLTITEMPAHTHTFGESGGASSSGQQLGGNASNTPYTTSSTGGDGAHNNLQPYLTVNFIIKT